MSYYCEKCQLICEQDSCVSCGNKNLRAPQNNDFCFMIETTSMYGTMFENILIAENIPCAALPVGNGVRSFFGLKLENTRIYVPFEFFLNAKQVLAQMQNNFRENQNGEFLKYIDKLHTNIRSEKKVKKHLKLAKEENLIAYCIDKIIHADEIANKGKISSCIKGGDYFFAYKADELFVINSTTYELLSAKKIK